MKYACIVAGRRLSSRGGCRYYVLVNARRRLSDMDPNGKIFYAKLEEVNGGLGDKIHH